MASFDLASILYADDTLMICRDHHFAQHFLDCIRSVGYKFGLELNDAKCEILGNTDSIDLRDSKGKPIPIKQSIRYLGSLLSIDGRVHSELSQRIGFAQMVFTKLARIWKHANVSRQRKVKIYESCVLSLLMYGLHVSWLNQAERSRLDGFHCKCIRRIFNIPHSFISRVSNAEVLAIAKVCPLHHTLLKHQLLMYGKIALRPDSDPIRSFVMLPSSSEPLQSTIKRRRGRPLTTWMDQVHKHVAAIRNSTHMLSQPYSFSRFAFWRSAVDRYVQIMSLETID